ncbi:hypothetical protein LEA_00750, partial [human gut metagenome]
NNISSDDDKIQSRVVETVVPVTSCVTTTTSPPVTTVTTVKTTMTTTTVVTTTNVTTTEVEDESYDSYYDEEYEYDYYDDSYDEYEYYESDESDEEEYVEYVEEEDNTYSDSESGDMTLLGNLYITGYVETGNPTASGVYPYVGGVAMSTSYGLPYGTTIYIEGLGYYTLFDTGCNYGVVDVFCNTVDECYNLTSWRNVYVVN